MVYRWEEGGEGRRLNAFRNDGSFLETFKRLQEEEERRKASGEGPSSSEDKKEEPPATAVQPEEKKKLPESSTITESSAIIKKAGPLVGKRRGGRVLPTGKVKKAKAEDPSTKEVSPGDAWSLYLAEVKRYKETTCEEDGKTRPLVK
jgi:hypothetical protein